MVSLKNEAMRDRHWNDLMAKTGAEYFIFFFKYNTNL